LTVTLAGTSAVIGLGYMVYRDVAHDRFWPFDSSSSLDDNDESVSQSELDTHRSQAEQLLDAELYRTRSSTLFVPLRLFFRTLKLLIVFTPVIIFYFIQDKFLPRLYERWCLTLKQ
jgi:hypothetical protein